LVRIHQVGYNLIPKSGGVYTSAQAFTSALLQAGHSVECVSFTDPAAIPSEYPSLWKHVAVTRSRLGRAYADVREADLKSSEKKLETADLIFVHLLYRRHAVWAARFARARGIPIVVVPHGALDPWVFSYRGKRKRIWLLAYRSFLFGSGSTILFATEAEATKAASIISPGKSRIISWPVSRLTTTDNPLERVRGRCSTRELLFAGRLHPMKRILETVTALRNLDRRDWRLTIAGPATEEISVRMLERTAGSDWGARIRYVGPQNHDQLGQLYATSDALVLFSHRENFGYVVAEAMCEGLPVAISDAVDLHPVVQRAGAGIVKTIRTENDIRTILSELLDAPPGDLTRMGISGARSAQSEFPFEKFVESLNALVRDCARERNG
jgi:glycosyltransferase involved in cell wall biosynthesis